MSLPLVFRPIAQAEFVEAAVRYERQSAGLGVDFVAKVQQVLETITEQPKRYPIVLRDIREAPVARFPYCVYYRAKRIDLSFSPSSTLRVIPRSGRPAHRIIERVGCASRP